MPNPKLETYKNKATGTVYDYTDAAAQAALADILDGTDIDSFSDVETALATKVDKVTGKGLSTNDYDNTAKGIVDNIQSNVIANTKLIKDTVGWSGKNKGQWINKSLGGDATSGYKLDNGGSSLIARVKQNTSYIVSRKHEQGNRFRIIGFVNEPSSVADLSSEQLYSNNSADTYTVNSGSYNYLVFTYDSATSISQDTAEAMLRDASILDDTYEPYFGSTAFPRSEQAVLGATNLLDVDANTSSQFEKNASGQMTNHTTDTVSTLDFAIQGRKNGTFVKYLVGSQSGHNYITSTGKYEFKFTIEDSDDINQLYIGHKGNTNNVMMAIPFIRKGTFYFSANFVGVNPSTQNGYTMANNMVALSSNAPYAPYAMTNKELTDAVTKETIQYASKSDAIATLNKAYIKKVGSVCQCVIDFVVGSANINAWTNLVTFSENTGISPGSNQIIAIRDVTDTTKSSIVGAVINSGNLQIGSALTAEHRYMASFSYIAES